MEGRAKRRGIVTVRSAFHGNVEEKEEVKRGQGRKDREREREWLTGPSCICQECLCTACECVSYAYEVVLLALLPLCGAGGLGSQVVHHSGNARDFLDLIHHL